MSFTPISAHLSIKVAIKDEFCASSVPFFSAENSFLHNLSSFLYREERGKQFLAQLHLPAVEFLAARMDSMSKPTGKDSRRFVEGD